MSTYIIFYTCMTIASVALFYYVNRQPQVLIVPYKSSHSISKKYDDDAGFDLYADQAKSFEPNETFVIATGTRVQIPKGYYGEITTRSSIRKRGFICQGTIDAGYTGELGVIMTNCSNNKEFIDVGERVAQLIIKKIPRVRLVTVSEFEKTERGEKGFGSTGK